MNLLSLHLGIKLESMDPLYRVLSTAPSLWCKKVYIRHEKGFPSGSMVKNPPGMQELQGTLFWSLSREDPLEEGMQPTPVLLPGESHGQRSLVGYSPWGRKELNTTEWLHLTEEKGDLDGKNPGSNQTQGGEVCIPPCFPFSNPRFVFDICKSVSVL